MALKDKEIVLITGANVGLGLEIARELLRSHGNRFYVFVGCRTLSKGEAAVKELHDQGLTGCEVIQIDVTDLASIERAKEVVEGKCGRLDVLHANAGIAPDKDMLPAKEPISKIILETMQTNAAGAAQTFETFAPLLSKAENPRVIFMSSGLGCIWGAAEHHQNKDWPAYSSSKAALNMLMCYYAGHYPAWKINCCCPGFRATALNHYGSTNKEIAPGKLEDGARNAIRLTLLGKDGETGTFTQRNDKTGEIRTMPW